jgi:hypothetical protein
LEDRPLSHKSRTRSNRRSFRRGPEEKAAVPILSQDPHAFLSAVKMLRALGYAIVKGGIALLEEVRIVTNPPAAAA